ncbi:hypothetical protein BDW22DRAFT_882923 [Trametopsis cervina]|nr:hypothetical protein BDW22DRAFT_882923 [Trametopsis cervina]
MPDIQEKELIARVEGMKLFGVREHIQRPPHSFITIAVDGEQQIQTPISEDTLSPTWSFSSPLKLMVRASSIITCSVYREHMVLSKLGNKNHYCGQVEMELQTVLTDPYMRHPVQVPWYSREENLELSVQITLEPTFRQDMLLEHAAETLQGHRQRHDSTKSNTAMSLIGFAVENLDQLVNIVDGLVEIHPMCKVAWMILGSVYKAFKNQHELDGHSKRLAAELKETLAYAKECRDLKAIPEATDVILEIAKLVVQSASVFDAHMKHSITTRTVIGAANKTNQNRLLACDEQLKVLRKKLQEVLTIRIFQGQSILLANNGLNKDNHTLATTGSKPIATPPHTYYLPLEYKHLSGYSPIYTSPPEEPHRIAAHPSPPPTTVFPEVDGLRRFTSSPEPIDHLTTTSMPPPPPPGIGQSNMPNYTHAPSPMWSPWPMSSRTPSLFTDGGRTLSTCSSQSSLAEPCDYPESDPTIFRAEFADDETERMQDCASHSCHGHDSLHSSKTPSSPNELHFMPIAMPIPTSWSPPLQSQIA